MPGFRRFEDSSLSISSRSALMSFLNLIVSNLSSFSGSFGFFVCNIKSIHATVSIAITQLPFLPP